MLNVIIPSAKGNFINFYITVITKYGVLFKGYIVFEQPKYQLCMAKIWRSSSIWESCSHLMVGCMTDQGLIRSQESVDLVCCGQDRAQLKALILLVCHSIMKLCVIFALGKSRDPLEGAGVYCYGKRCLGFSLKPITFTHLPRMSGIKLIDGQLSVNFTSYQWLHRVYLRAQRVAASCSTFGALLTIIF